MPRQIYLMGLNQPDPSAPALWPDPPGCAGHRLWQMVNMVCGVRRGTWCRATFRTNLLEDGTLPPDYRWAARNRAEFLVPLIEAERWTVVLLGADVANAIGHGTPMFVWSNIRPWVAIPHPSGRNHFYNDPVCRLATGTLLADLLCDRGWITPRSSEESQKC